MTTLHRRSRRVASGLRLLALLLPLSACLGYKSIPLPRGDNGPQHLPSRTRVITTDGRNHVLYQPTVNGDSIIGRALTNRTLRVALAVNDVRRVEVYHVQVLKSGAVILLSGLGTVLVLGLLLATAILVGSQV